MKTIIIFGIPGTGKRTVSEALSKLIGLPFFHNHDILDVVRAFLPHTSPQAVVLAREFRRQLFSSMAELQCPGVVTSIAGGSPGVHDWMERMTNDIEAHGGIVHFVELRCAYDELLKRINTPERQKGTKLRTKEQLDQFFKKDYFKGLPTHPPLVIDNTNLSPEAAAQLIKEKLAL